MTYDLNEKLEPTVSEAAHFETGHEALMRAVLVDALKVYERGFDTKDVVRRKEAREVAAWVAIDDHEWPFSFVNVCTCLGVDPDCLRAELHRMRKHYAEPGATEKDDATDERQTVAVQRISLSGTEAA